MLTLSDLKLLFNTRRLTSVECMFKCLYFATGSWDSVDALFSHASPLNLLHTGTDNVRDQHTLLPAHTHTIKPLNTSHSAFIFLFLFLMTKHLYFYIAQKAESQMKTSWWQKEAYWKIVTCVFLLIYRLFGHLYYFEIVLISLNWTEVYLRF